jgi:ATP-binding cassette, subfamily B, bacterial PglK
VNLLSDIWSVLTSQQRRWVVWAQVLSIVMAFSTVTGIASIAPFFSVLADPQLIDHSVHLRWLYIHLGFSDTRSFEVALGLSFLTMVLFANLINVIGSCVMIRVAWWISTDLQSALFREYLSRPYVFHAKTHSAALFNNIIYETTRVTNNLLQNVFVLITNIATATLIILSVMFLDPTVGTAMIAALAGGYVAIYLVMRNRLFRAGRIQSHFFTEQTKIVNETLGAIKEILVLRIQHFFRGHFERSSVAFARAAAHTQLVGQSPRHVMESVAAAGLVLIALLAGRKGGGVGLWLGQMTFLGFAAYRLLPTLQQGFAAVVGIRADRAGFDAIAPDLRLARAGTHAPRSPDSSWKKRPRREIRLKEVSFRYQADRPPAVNGVSLRIPAGAVVGFAGANGSGKTTVVDLVAGLLVPGAGHIEVDGLAIDDANRESWQSRIAYVPQNISLLDTTLAQNIALGVAVEDMNQGRLLAAARLAQLHEFVGTLPGGYEHVVGERGRRLSGGQRQRVGIARALYADATVLILDEATSALDGLTGQDLMATIYELRGRYTVILVAHQLTTLRACDVIFQFDRGKLLSSGTYVELLRNSEGFRRAADVSH